MEEETKLKKGETRFAAAINPGLLLKKKMENREKIILDLCGGTGSWRRKDSIAGDYANSFKGSL